jgi:ribosomal protein S18 acetylase RimI-like enzyme
MSLGIRPSERLPSGYRMRLAEEADAPAVRRLDDLCFPPDSIDLQRAEEGELETSIRGRDVLVLEYHDSLLAYLQADTSVPGRIYCSGLGVHPAAQGRGLGSKVVEECLSSLDEARRSGLSIVTITSPRNLRMLSILFRYGFAGRWALRDFFGCDRHRLGLQLRSIGAQASPSGQVWIPTGEVDEVLEAIEHRGLVVRAVVNRRAARLFELAPVTDGEEFPEGQPPPVPQLSAPAAERGAHARSVPKAKAPSSGHRV